MSWLKRLLGRSTVEEITKGLGRMIQQLEQHAEDMLDRGLSLEADRAVIDADIATSKEQRQHALNVAKRLRGLVEG